MTINNGVPSFHSVLYTHDVTENYTYYAMALRDCFAGQALSAMITKSPFFDRDGEFGNPTDMKKFKADMAESAYFYSDAMLAERGAK